MPKQSQLPQDASPSLTDRLTGLQVGIPQAVTYLMSTLINFFWTLANIPSGATSPITRDNYTTLPFVANGLVWSGNAYNSTLLASMTTGVVFINGRFITIAAVSGRAFTASKDTYIDVLDNGDGTGTLVYTTVTNNAASPALAANSIRIGIIITGASSIAAATSVNQGQETMILPIASSIAYSVTDSLGNLICCRDPLNKLLGMRQILASFTAGSATLTAVTGLSVPVIVPTGRKVKITIYTQEISSVSSSQVVVLGLYLGTVTSGNQLQLANVDETSIGSFGDVATLTHPYTPAAASNTYNVGISTTSGDGIVAATTTAPAYIMVELE